MELAAWVLLVAFGVVGIASTIVYRDYRRLYAQVHRDDAPFVSYMFERDPNAEVEAARVRSRNLGWLGLALALLCVAAITLSRSPTA